jgi:hypothetical protein
MWISPHLEDYAKDCYVIADAMLDAKYADNAPEVGIATVKKRKTKEE